jgi:hypothetical protein
MDRDDILSCDQKPYPEPDESIPHSPASTLDIYFNTTLQPKGTHSRRFILPKLWSNISSVPCVLHTPPILSSLILSSGFGMATGYKLGGRGAGVPVKAGFFISPERADMFWGASSLLSNWYWELIPRNWSGRDVKLTTHFYLVPRSRMVQLYLHSPYTFMAWCLIS